MLRAKDYIRQDNQSSDISQERSARSTAVHYPEELEHAHSAQYFNTPPNAPSFAGTDEDDNEDDEFDWSGDEDLADEEAKFGKQMGVNLRARRWTIWRFVRFSYADKRALRPSHFQPVRRLVHLLDRLDLPRLHPGDSCPARPFPLVQTTPYQLPTLCGPKHRSMAFLGGSQCHHILGPCNDRRHRTLNNTHFDIHCMGSCFRGSQVTHRIV